MRKKIIIMMAVIALISVFTFGNAFAGWYYNMNIVKIGSGASGVVIKVQNDTGSVVVQKFVSPTIKNEVLAVALTAQSMISKVHVYLDTGLNEFTDITVNTVP